MNIIEHIKKNNENNRKTFSVELLPPRNGESIEQVYKVLEDLSDLKLDFVSITHGSGGSLRGGTEALGALVRERYGIEPLIHLTCLDQSRETLENQIMVLKYLELNNILALRGDPPWGEKDFKSHPQGHKRALDLIQQIEEINKGHYLLRKSDHMMYKLSSEAKYREGEQSNFVVYAACYPEGHPEGSTLEQEVDYAVSKLKAGAKMLITQMLFDVNIYKSFVQKVSEQYPNPIVIPGIMPLVKKSQVGFVKKMFGVTVPEEYKESLEKNPKEEGIRLCAELCQQLFDVGAPGVHFFTMNESDNVRSILSMVKNGSYKVCS